VRNAKFCALKNTAVTLEIAMTEQKQQQQYHSKVWGQFFLSQFKKYM